MKLLKKIQNNLLSIIVILLVGDIIVNELAVEIPLWVNYIRMVIYMILLLIGIWGIWDFIKKK